MSLDVIVLHDNNGERPLKIKEYHLKKMREIADHVWMFRNEEELLESKADAEVLFAWGGGGPQPETFCSRSEKLRWFHTYSAGVDAVMGSSIADLPVIITNAAGIHGKPMGITAMGYIISWLREFPQMMENQRNHIRKKPENLPEEPEGKTLGIVGAGTIGAEVAKYGKALGFRVVGVKRKVMELPFFDQVYSDGEIKKALSEMDFVVILTPLTSQTRKMFGKELFASCRKGAYIINIARGGVVDTPALVEALQEGHLGGAALDAITEEDLTEDSPLWDMPNVFLTPQYSATSPMYMDRAVEQFVSNLKRFRDGQELFNMIDKANLR